MYYFGDVMYAMGMNIMKSVCVKYGQTNDTGKKFVKFDEVVKLVGDASKEPNNSGDYKDYIELMKLYDKNENGTIMIAELETMLSLLGNLFNPKRCGLLGGVFLEKWSLSYQILFQMKI